MKKATPKPEKDKEAEKLLNENTEYAMFMKEKLDYLPIFLSDLKWKRLDESDFATIDYFDDETELRAVKVNFKICASLSKVLSVILNPKSFNDNLEVFEDLRKINEKLSLSYVRTSSSRLISPRDFLTLRFCSHNISDLESEEKVSSSLAVTSLHPVKAKEIATGNTNTNSAKAIAQKSSNNKEHNDTKLGKQLVSTNIIKPESTPKTSNVFLLNISIINDEVKPEVKNVIRAVQKFGGFYLTRITDHFTDCTMFNHPDMKINKQILEKGLHTAAYSQMKKLKLLCESKY